ncbi:MAG TPA: hypothetical protein VMU64_12720 [Acidimicrobiales bacterium]|nr:hypothetical protein [Acidimicrobiales bacterium]
MGPSSSGQPAPFIAPQQGKRRIGVGHISTTLAARARPTSSSRDQLLPVLLALAPLFPQRGLQRGGVVTIDIGDAGGGTTLGFALLAAASRASWCAAVGLADPGMVACAELGVDLGHLVLVPRPGPLWAQAAATLFDGMDVVLLRPPGPVRRVLARRLAARARERRGVLVVLGSRTWPEGGDVQLTVGAGVWQGVEAGHGHLQGRHLEVLSSGRRAAARPVRVGLWLPGPSGQVVADPTTGERSKREAEGEGAAAGRDLVSRHP